MNIVGKILVILNLLFALAVGGFLIVDFGTRTNWAKAYEDLKKEMEVARVRAGLTGSTNANLANDLRKVSAELTTERQKVIDAEAVLKIQETQHNAKLEEQKQLAKDADINLAKAVAEKERLKDENKLQLDVIKKRDDLIVAGQAEIAKLRSYAAAEESARKATQDRLEQALGENAKLTQAVARAQTGASPDIVAKGKPNPPNVYVEGKIDEVDGGNTGLVRITVGSDKGLIKNHTLEVFRVDPPLHLGYIRIVDVQPHSAIGRLERANALNTRVPLRVGDTVASSLTRN